MVYIYICVCVYIHMKYNYTVYIYSTYRSPMQFLRQVCALAQKNLWPRFHQVLWNLAILRHGPRLPSKVLLDYNPPVKLRSSRRWSLQHENLHKTLGLKSWLVWLVQVPGLFMPWLMKYSPNNWVFSILKNKATRVNLVTWVWRIGVPNVTRYPELVVFSNIWMTFSLTDYMGAS